MSGSTVGHELGEGADARADPLLQYHLLPSNPMHAYSNSQTPQMSGVAGDRKVLNCILLLNTKTLILCTKSLNPKFVCLIENIFIERTNIATLKIKPQMLLLILVCRIFVFLISTLICWRTMSLLMAAMTCSTSAVTMWLPRIASLQQLNSSLGQTSHNYK